MGILIFYIHALLPNHLYHCYNQGNNQEIIFGSEEDYFAFIRLTRHYVSPQCNVLAWCLMPNHFHFLFHTTASSVEAMHLGNITSQNLTNSLGLVLSKYAQIFNESNSRSGSLFRQKTKFKDISDGDGLYDVTVLDYIHYNPVVAGLVRNACEWEYSSAKDFAGLKKGTLANVEMAKEILGM